MNDFDKRIIAEYPQFFTHHADPLVSMMGFGCECGPGWYPIIEALLKELATMTLPEDFEIVQIKNKFGSLVIFAEGATHEIWDVFEKYEDQCQTICMQCGKPGKSYKIGIGYLVMCADCYKQRGL